MNRIIVLVLLFSFATISYGQNLYFKDAGHNKTFSSAGKRVIVPEKYRGLTFCYPKARKFLKTVPSEKNITDRNKAPIFSLIKPDGTIAKFRIWESIIQEGGDKNSADYIFTFTGQGIDDPYATIRFDIGPNGFHAQILTVNGDYYIDPYTQGNIKKYISYFKSDLKGGRRNPDMVEPPNQPTRLPPIKDL